MASSAKRPILVLESSFPVVCLSTVSVVDSVVIIIITRILRIVTPQPGPACLASSANRPILIWGLVSRWVPVYCVFQYIITIINKIIVIILLFTCTRESGVIGESADFVLGVCFPLGACLLCLSIYNNNNK